MPLKLETEGVRGGSSAMHISIGHDRNLLPYPTIDSDAIPVLESVIPELGPRVREIFKHITNN